MEHFSNTADFVPQYETNSIQDGNGQQGTTGLVVPLYLETEQHQLNQQKSPKELRRSGPKATLTEHQKKVNKKQSDQKYRQKQKGKLQNLERYCEELNSEIQILKRQARENSSENEGIKMETEKLQSQQHELVHGQRDVRPMLVGFPAATVPISSFGPPQLGASSSTLTEFAPPTSNLVNSNLTTFFSRDVSNNRLIFFNSSTHLPLKLTPSNFSAWRQQLRALLIGYGLIGFVDGSIPSPPATPALPADPNSYFNLWQRQDQLILHFILTSVIESMLPHLSSAQTSRDAWVTLHNLFADDRLLVREESLQRHNNVELPVTVTANVAQRNTRRQGDSRARFRSGASNSRQNTPPVMRRLLAHEESLQRHNNVEPPVVVTANVAQGNAVQQADSDARFGSGASNRRRPRQNAPTHGQQEVGYNIRHMPNVNTVLVCQFCDSNGHVAKSCPKLATHDPLIKCVTSQTNDWSFDIGANTHAANGSVLSSLEYEATDSVVNDDVTVRGGSILMYRGVPTTRPE